MSYNKSKIWHPRQHPNSVIDCPPIRIVRGEGCYVTDDQGSKYLDGVAGLFNVYVGHDRKEIKDAIAKQLDELCYYPILAGLSHPRAEELSVKLVEMLEPEDMQRVIFGSGGSDAVETALMLSRQYWKVVGQPERTKFISLKNSYHGSNFGSGAVSGNTSYRKNYEPLLPGCFHIESPWLYRNMFTNDSEELGQICADLVEKEILFQGPNTVAAFIAEPVQATGGIIVPPENYWPLIRKVCDKYDVLLIADEVVTGFGRTGNMFGSRGWNVKPDIMCLAKGITSGYMPLGATVFNRRISDAFHDNSDFRGAIMHGYTYAGHPLACAAGLANLKIINEEKLDKNAEVQGNYLLSNLQVLKDDNSYVGDVRGKGLLVCIDLVEDKKTREPLDPAKGYADYITDQSYKDGLLIRALSGNKIVMAPPLVATKDEMDKIISILKNAFKESNKHKKTA